MVKCQEELFTLKVGFDTLARARGAVHADDWRLALILLEAFFAQDLKRLKDSKRGESIKEKYVEVLPAVNYMDKSVTLEIGELQSDFLEAAIEEFLDCECRVRR